MGMINANVANSLNYHNEHHFASLETSDGVPSSKRNQGKQRNVMVTR
jgi:hypothetical protein